jgi:hypothetical protein
MLKCRIADFLYRAVPLYRWRSFLIRRHMEACPLCQAGLASRDEALLLLTRDSDVKDVGFLWPGIRRRLLKEGPVEPGKPRIAWKLGWNSALGAAAAVAVATSLVLFFRGFRPETITAPESGNNGIQVVSLMVGGRPADAVYFHPQDSEMVIIWAEKVREGGVTP